MVHPAPQHPILGSEPCLERAFEGRADGRAPTWTWLEGFIDQDSAGRRCGKDVVASPRAQSRVKPSGETAVNPEVDGGDRRM